MSTKKSQWDLREAVGREESRAGAAVVQASAVAWWQLGRTSARPCHCAASLPTQPGGIRETCGFCCPSFGFQGSLQPPRGSQ